MGKFRRLPLIDSLRGFAMVIMAIYHFCFDLNTFAVIHQNFNYDFSWLTFRAIIMSLFTGLAGVGFYLGHAKFSSRSFSKRLYKLIACASLISIVTYFMYPRSWVFFGIIHFMVIASLLGPLLVRIPKFCLPLGIFLIALPNYFTHEIFRGSFLISSGLSPVKPNTEDFAPLCPWLGVVLIGVFIGYVIENKNWKVLFKESKALSFLGHHSLVFYMTHQLVLFPLAWLVSILVK
ncbi:MAG: DUF1624 domain-containing protein [Bdellovibrionales bacterium]|nr:DUF1624 domain-containing protein [Bdellovibrionales bacterium]